MAGENDEVFMTVNFNVTLKTAEHHLIVRIRKSEANNNKIVRSRYYTDEAILLTERIIARPLCNSRAT